MQLDLTELRELLAALDQTNIAELTLKSSDFELTVRKNFPVAEVVTSQQLYVNPVVELPPPQTISTPPAATNSPATPPPATTDKKLLEVIISPMVGTFYRAPGPDEPPFVEIGDRINVGSTVCIIEAMKLMNEIEAEVSGTVVEILGKNAEPVEYGQVLMRVKPD